MAVSNVHNDCRSRHQFKSRQDDTMNQNISAAATANRQRTPHVSKEKIFLFWNDLPKWCQDNEYIYSGFRPISNSYGACFRSLFYIHNETGNILSHLLATIWMIALPIFFYPYAKDTYPSATVDDGILFGLFFFGGAICFALSACFHALCSHSHTVHDLWHRLDFLGIIAVTSGCFPPGLWYTFPSMNRETKMVWISVC